MQEIDSQRIIRLVEIHLKNNILINQLTWETNKKPKWLENSQLLRKTWHVNEIFELILEQCVANYYGDNTIAK